MYTAVNKCKQSDGWAYSVKGIKYNSNCTNTDDWKTYLSYTCTNTPKNEQQYLQKCSDYFQSQVSYQITVSDNDRMLNEQSK